MARIERVWEDWEGLQLVADVLCRLGWDLCDVTALMFSELDEVIRDSRQRRMRRRQLGQQLDSELTV